MTDLTPPKLTIDDYQQLITDSLTHLQIVSNGEISDTSPSGFLRPFAGTLAFIGSELLFKANLTAEAAAKTFLSEVVGTPENVGQRSVTILQFGLSTALTSNFVVPAGFQVSDSTGTLRYYTDSSLTIPAGSTSGQISATAEDIGARYNVAINAINRFSQPLTYLEYVVNIEPATNGSDPETPENLIERAAIAIRTRNPVSALDFEQFASVVMGEGSRAKAIGLLARDQVAEQKGAVHLFLLNKDGQPATQAQIALVGQALSPRLMLGTKLNVSSMELIDINLDLIGEATGEKQLQDITDQCFEAMRSYFDYRTYPIGASVLLEEVKFALRSVGGFTITALDINQSPQNIPMPNNWTLPNFVGINFELITTDGATFFDSQFVPLIGDE